MKKLGVLSLALTLGGCQHKTQLVPNLPSTPLALSYIAQSEVIGAAQARKVMGCLPEQWVNMANGEDMLAAMRMDGAAAMEIDRRVGRTSCEEGNLEISCCQLGYYAFQSRSRIHAIRWYTWGCEPLGGKGYLGCLPLLAVWPHVSNKEMPDWMPKLSRGDRVGIAAWAIDQARIDKQKFDNE